MADTNEKPLYTLWKALGRNNYDVPDNYEDFEYTLTLPGEEGSLNRQRLYKSLYDSNYDVPDNYNDFANTLFAPVEQPVTSAPNAVKQQDAAAAGGNSGTLGKLGGTGNIGKLQGAALGGAIGALAGGGYVMGKDGKVVAQATPVQQQKQQVKQQPTQQPAQQPTAQPQVQAQVKAAPQQVKQQPAPQATAPKVKPQPQIGEGIFMPLMKNPDSLNLRNTEAFKKGWLSSPKYDKNKRFKEARAAGYKAQGAKFDKMTDAQLVAAMREEEKKLDGSTSPQALQASMNVTYIETLMAAREWGLGSVSNLNALPHMSDYKQVRSQFNKNGLVDKYEKNLKTNIDDNPLLTIGWEKIESAYMRDKQNGSVKGITDYINQALEDPKVFEEFGAYVTARMKVKSKRWNDAVREAVLDFAARVGQDPETFGKLVEQSYTDRNEYYTMLEEIGAMWKDVNASARVDAYNNTNRAFAGAPSTAQAMQGLFEEANYRRSDPVGTLVNRLLREAPNAKSWLSKRAAGYIKDGVAKDYKTAERMARRDFESIVVGKLVDMGMPKSDTGYVLATGLLNSTAGLLTRTITTGLSGKNGGKYDQIAQQELQQYGQTKASSGARVAAAVAPLAVDIVTGVGFTGPSALGQGTKNLFTKGMAQAGKRAYGLTTKAAIRRVEQNAGVRFIGSGLSGAVNFGTYTGRNTLLQQYAQTGQVDVVEAGKEGGKAAANGFVFGVVGEGMGALTNGWTGGKALLGEGATVVVEGTTFTALDAMWGDEPITKETIAKNFGMGIAGRVGHLPTYVKNVTARYRGEVGPVKKVRLSDESYNALKGEYPVISEMLHDQSVITDISKLMKQGAPYGKKSKSKALTVYDPTLAEGETSLWEQMGKELDAMKGDSRVPWEVVRMADWVLNGTVMPEPMVMGSGVRQKEDGKYEGVVLDQNGRTITRYDLGKDEKKAGKWQSSMNDVALRNQAIVAEGLARNKSISDALLESVKGMDIVSEDGRKLSPEEITGRFVELYNKMQSGETLSVKESELFNQVMEGAEKAHPELDIVNQVKIELKEQRGIDIDEVMKKKPSKLTQEEKQALGYFLNEITGPDIMGAEGTEIGATPATEEPYKLKGPDTGAVDELARSAMVVDSRVFTEEAGGDGMVHPATLKGEGGAGYIVSGRVLTTADGQIDLDNSDSDIIIVDENGEKRMIDIHEIAELGDILDPAELKQVAANEMLGANTPQGIEVGGRYEVSDDAGTHEVEVLRDNGNGSVEISVDGEQHTMGVEQLKQMLGIVEGDNSETLSPTTGTAQGDDNILNADNTLTPDNEMVEADVDAGESGVSLRDKAAAYVDAYFPDVKGEEREGFIEQLVAQNDFENTIRYDKEDGVNLDRIAKYEQRIVELEKEHAAENTTEDSDKDSDNGEAVEPYRIDEAADPAAISEAGFSEDNLAATADYLNGKIDERAYLERLGFDKDVLAGIDDDKVSKWVEGVANRASEFLTDKPVESGDVRVESDEVPADAGTTLTPSPQPEAADATEVEAAPEPMPMREVGKGKNKTTEPDWLAVTPERGHDWLFNEIGLDNADANDIVNANLETAKKGVEKASKQKPKKTANPLVLQSERERIKGEQEAAQAVLDYWERVKAIEADREAQAAAERKAADAEVIAQAQVDEQARQAAELAKQQEQAERGAGGVLPSAEEVALRDGLVEVLRGAGIEVVTDEAEGQRVLDAANRAADVLDEMKKRNQQQETALPEDESSFKGTAISSADGAKVIKNLESGINALKKIAEGAESVPNAMTREDLSQYGGDNHITFIFGKTGDPSRSYKGGYGIAHIGGKHGADTLLHVLNVIAKGKIDRYVRGNKTVVLSDGKYEVVLGLTRYGNKETWLFNGWRKDEKTGADGEVSTHSDATQANPTFSREDLGAVLSDAKIQQIVDTSKDLPGKIREMRAWHGSGADFDAFDHSHMGEGEGAQAYGWGTYVTQVEGIARNYAGDGNKYIYKGRKVYGNPYSKDIAEQAAFYIEQEQGINNAIRFLRGLARDLKGMPEGENFKDILSVLQDKDNWSKPKRYLYEVEIPDNDGTNYLPFDKPLTDEQLERIASRLGNEDAADFRASYQPVADAPNADEVNAWSRRGENILRQLSWLFGHDGRINSRAASEFLHDCGFVGIEYPAQYRSGGRSDGTKNYVIFDEGDLKINSKTQFFRTGNGEVYGFVRDGKIYLDPRVASAETPVHEYSHLWADALKRANPEAWERLKETMLGEKDVLEHVKHLYPELEGDELLGEVFSHYSGKRGAERLRADMEREMGEAQGIYAKARVAVVFDKIRRALSRFWQMARDLFAGKNSMLNGMRAEDFADMAMADMLRGFDPRGVEKEIALNETHYHKVTDKAELERLNNEPTVVRYRAMQMIDGKLYPPMSAQVKGELREPTELGVWERSDERPDLVDKNGKFKLQKGKRFKENKEGQGDTPAAYNPYFHTSTSMMNDQFTAAYVRPELVVVKVEIPESELSSGYKAEKAKDAVGNIAWHSGPVNGALPKDRQRTVTLSRYCKVTEVVPDAEVAEAIAKQLEGLEVEVPYNVVTPNVRAELEARGVKISATPSGSVTRDINGELINRGEAAVANEDEVLYEPMARTTGPDIALDDRVSQREYLLSDNYVARLTGNEFAKSDTPLTERVAQFYTEKYGGKVEREGFGMVHLDKRGVKDSLSHGLGRNKAAAFAAVPSIIKDGALIDHKENFKGRNQDSYTLAAPVEIGDKGYVGVVIVTRGKGTDRNKFYLHEVILQKNLLSEEFKTGIDTGSKQGENLHEESIKTDTKADSHQGDVAKVLKEIVTAKENSGNVANEDAVPYGDVNERGSSYRNGNGDVIKFESHAEQLSLFGGVEQSNKRVIEQAKREERAKAVAAMSDAELLKEMQRDIAEFEKLGRGDWGIQTACTDEYDRRHIKEYNAECERVRTMLDENNVSIEEAEDMLCNAIYSWRDGYATADRSKLLAQFDTLNDYYAELEERGTRNEERDEDEAAAMQPPTEQTADETGILPPTPSTIEGEKSQKPKRAGGFDPSAIKLRKLKNGETCHVERRYQESGGFDFTGSEKVESDADLAYIFRNLENSAIENTFLVLIKNGKATILHTGMGSYAASVGHVGAGLLAASKLKPDHVIFVHNHPSGRLEPSVQDVAMQTRAKKMFGEGVVREAIIIDITSGEYCTFDDGPYNDTEVKKRPTEVENEIPYKTYSFSQYVFDKNYKPGTTMQITDANKAAAFISSHRLGERDKMSLIVMNRAKQITGNIFLPWTNLDDVDITKAANKIATYIHQMGGESGIIYGSGSINRSNLSSLSREIENHEVRLDDFINVEGVSAQQEGVLEDEVLYEAVPRNTEQQPTEVAEDGVGYGEADGCSDIVCPCQREHQHITTFHASQSGFYFSFFFHF